MKHIARLVVALTLALSIAACTAGGTGAPSLNHSNPHDPNFSALQFAVGTANLYGMGNPALNVVSTLRQPNGTSAAGANTPILSGPFTFATGPVTSLGLLAGFADLYTTIPNGRPSLPETIAAAPVIVGTSQTVHPGTPPCDTAASIIGFNTCPPGIAPNDTSFGQSGGVFANGLAPFNSTGGGVSYSYQPYAQPVYASSLNVLAPAGADAVHQFVPWGGPPAFDPDRNGMGTRDGLVPIFFDSFNAPVFLGVGENITTFEFVTPRTGTYALSAQIGTLGSGGTPVITTITATAPLNSLALLPTLTTPLVTPDANGDGGATFTATLPGGVTEALVQIVDWGPGGGPNNGASVANCQGPKGTSFAPVYYTVFITASGTYQLGALHGANTNLSGGVTNLTPSHSLCTLADNQSPPDGVAPATAGDNFTVEMIGFDYPAYEATVSLLAPTVPQRPVILGPSGQDDITISQPMEQDYPNYNVQIPLSAARHGFAPARYLRSFAAPALGADLARKLGVPTRVR